MERKLLTIIIPTYNRCVQVKENLNLVIPQVLDNKEYVQIFVSDNASTDGTQEMMSEFLDKYGEILSYHRHVENITASPNFNFAVHAVDSEYVYILGDDDLILPHFLSTILALVKKHPSIGLFHFNYLLGIDDLKDCRLLYKHIDVNALSLFQTGEDFIKKHLNGPSFISSNLFKRQLWLDGTNYANDECCGYVWLSIMYYGCINYQCAFYNIPMLIQRFPAKSPYSVKWPLYYVKGLGNLFSYLNDQIPGLYKEWICESQEKKKLNFLLLLTLVSRNKTFYRKEYYNLVPFIVSKYARLQLYLFIFIFPKWFTMKIYRNIILGLKLLNRII